MQAKFFSGDCIVTEELVTAAGGPQFTNGVLMTFGQDPRTLPDGKAVIEKFRASGFEPEGYTLYAYASIQAIAAAWNAVGTDNAKASDWLKSHDVETVMGKKAWMAKATSRCPTTWSISGTTRANITSSDRPRPEDALSFDLRIVT